MFSFSGVNRISVERREYRSAQSGTHGVYSTVEDSSCGQWLICDPPGSPPCQYAKIGRMPCPGLAAVGAGLCF